MSSPNPAPALVTYAARLVRVIGRAAGDSSAGLRILSQLDELGAITVTDLARADRTSQPTISAAVRALEARGLVGRVGHPDDARSSLLTLSPAGRAELTAARERHARLLRELVEARRVRPEDVETATRVLRALTEPEAPSSASSAPSSAPSAPDPEQR